MKKAVFTYDQVSFSPALKVNDPFLNYWLGQVTLRLRREICWLRYFRGVAPGGGKEVLPVFTDKSSEAIDLTRFWKEKMAFFSNDITAKYLSEQIGLPCPHPGDTPNRGTLAWIVKTLQLDDSATFILSLVLSTTFDRNTGLVISACMNDPAKTQPTFGLAQKLWDEPAAVLAVADPQYPLFAFGLLEMGTQNIHYPSYLNWNAPISIASILVNQILFSDPRLPHMLVAANKDTNDVRQLEGVRSEYIASRIRHQGAGIKIIPMDGPKDVPFLDFAQAIATKNGKSLVRFSGDPAFLENAAYRNALAAYCWLLDLDLFYGREITAGYSLKGKNNISIFPVRTIPINLFAAIEDRDQLKDLDSSLLLPIVRVPGFDFHQRVTCWRQMFVKTGNKKRPWIDKIARRFRFERAAIERIALGLQGMGEALSEKAVLQACSAELDTGLGHLAQKVNPRFKGEEVILPDKQSMQLLEIRTAMETLTRVHYEWGTAEAWNESGISVMFAGPPGTGKTMAAEVLAEKLDLPMYRIDLSQVVNKYIGETEKNLKRLFDAADQADLILFFDEADALFGRRTEVKDAHDRYANLEVSYLLERMERFKGLAILATNRKKDLDVAFMRRLRYIIEFPVPGLEQRKRIWEQVMPSGVDPSNLDLDFLANRFTLTGGHIRSIVFNAALQSAKNAKPFGKGKRYRMEMEDIIRAVKREHDKLGRKISLEQFGHYMSVVQKMEK